MRIHSQGVWGAAGTHVDEADIELLCRVAPLQVPPRIHVVVPHDPGDDV